MKNITLAIAIALSFSLATTVAEAKSNPRSKKAEQHVHWGYEGEVAPEHWGDLSSEYALCSTGKNQSPLNIQQTINTTLPEITFSYTSPATEVVNNGHTIQVNIAPGSSISLEGKSYELKQFHFHSPSENLIADKSFPLEAHFVHADAEGNLAVVGVMFSEGLENPTLKQIWSVMPAKADEKADVSKANLDFKNLLPESKDYYRYNGSLTTPPCSEGVRWIVLKQPKSLTAAQTEAFAHVVHGHNNRPIQPVNARQILE